jgi:hypothetical protein
LLFQDNPGADQRSSRMPIDDLWPEAAVRYPARHTGRRTIAPAMARTAADPQQPLTTMDKKDGSLARTRAFAQAIRIGRAVSEGKLYRPPPVT